MGPWAGFISLRIRSGGGLLRTQYGVSGSIKTGNIVTRCATISYSRTLLCGVLKYILPKWFIFATYRVMHVILVCIFK